MKKLTALILTLLLILSLSGCSDDVILSTPLIYTFDSQIHSLDIRINAADFVIKQGDEFSVESNLKHLTVEENNGILTIEEDLRLSINYTNAMLTLYVPEGTVFKDVRITTGAGKLTADRLASRSLKLTLGAGEVKIDRLIAEDRSDITGGAGKITISDGMLSNLELNMGVGELDMTTALCGSSHLSMGVGKSGLTLIGSRDDYTIDLEKGIGIMTVDGETVTDFGSSGSGDNRVSIEGGVGVFNLCFSQSE
jgi:hypothetical protein